MPPSQRTPVQIAQIFVPEIKELLAARSFRSLKTFLRDVSIVDLADVWDQFNPAEQTILFRLLPNKSAVALFQELDEEHQVHIANTLKSNELAMLLGDFNPEEAARLFHEMAPRTVAYLTRFMQRAQREDVARIMTYPDNTVGSWLRIQRVVLSPQMTSGQALAAIRQGARLRSADGPDGYYITEADGRVAGYISLRELIAAPTKIPIGQYMSPVRLLRLLPQKDQEEAARLFIRYGLSMAPIVDEADQLLGYIQAEDVIPLVQEEVTEDFAKIAGTGTAEFQSRSIFRTARIRFPWLIITCVGQLLVVLVIKHFDFVLREVLALASFMPFIAAMGGNAGSQAATILVRSMALHDFSPREKVKVVFQELGTGFLLGTLYGVVIGVGAFVLYGMLFGSLFPLVVGVAAITSMTVATTIGALAPLTLARLGTDPATATGPLVTTLTDIISTTLYFVLALILLL